MNPFKVLSEKPWLPLPAGEAAIAEQNPQAPAQIALRFFIAVVSVLFFLFTLTFLSRSQYPDFQALAGQPWQPFTDPSRLWFNTALLVFSSLAMHLGWRAARKGHTNLTISGVVAAAFFAVLFLLAQLDLWQQLQVMGFYVSSNPANSYFYLLTAVHGLHLIGGLVALSNVVFRVWYDGDPTTLGGPLKLCSTYWDFLLIVWLLLFALLTSTPDTINALAALCGF
ncbi:MAG: cytochrome c oxidase subunit 3 [Halioglobus sp.]